MEWAVGITTCPERQCISLPRTLDSLRRGGFQPRIFADGASESAYSCFGLPVTARNPRIGAWGNWILAINELFIRQPNADRYVIFQDDVVCVRNLRQYLEQSPYPEGHYCNLIMYPQNHENRPGWYRAPSGKRGANRGLGAQGLMFDSASMDILLGREFYDMTHKPRDPLNGKRRIDGAVVHKLEQFGCLEHVHSPSLLRHFGEVSTLGNGRQPETLGFPGENFDALSLRAEQ